MEERGDGSPSPNTKAKLLRAGTAPVLIPVHTFWHKGCVSRCCQLLGLFLLLAIGGTMLYVVVPLLGAAALAMGPSFIIMMIFYQRFQCSTTKLQAFYTFLEAIAWMFALFVIIEFVDMGNSALNGKDVELSCRWDTKEGSKVFVHALSFAAHCFHEGSPDPSGEWDGLDCEQMPMGLANMSLKIPQPQEGESGERVDPVHPLLLLHVATIAAKDVNGTMCEAIEDNVQDALTLVTLESVAFGGVMVDTSRRSGLRNAFDDLFGRKAMGLPGLPKASLIDCACKKTLREIDNVVPSYDFCSEDDRCNVSDTASCAWRGREATCSPADQSGEVTAVMSFRKKTVLYVFIEAYFRAAFLEELLKYVAVRRILFKDRVADCGGLIVYGLAAAAGFATAENIQYTMIHGVFVTYMRMVLSIPLHCCTGLMIGIFLGYRKFLGEGYNCCDKFWLALAMPVLTHGTYDFILMLPQTAPLDGAARMFLTLGVLVGGFVVCRLMWLRIDNVCVVHVKDLQAEGRISKSTCCCWDCDCCRAWCEQEDTVLKEGLRHQKQHVANGASYREPGSGSDSEGPTREGQHFVFRFSRSLSSALVPEAPTCQTREDTCPSCSNTVRVHVLYPSDCPFCGHTFPDPDPTMSPRA